MQFRMKSDITFDADNIDDAWLKLAHHFLSLSLDLDSTVFQINGGEIEIVKE